MPVVVGSCSEYSVGVPPLSTGTPLRAELIGPTQEWSFLLGPAVGRALLPERSLSDRPPLRVVGSL